MKKTREMPNKYWSKVLEGVTTEVGLLAVVKRQRKPAAIGFPHRTVDTAPHWELLH